VKALPLTDMFQVLKTSTTVFLTAGDVQQPYLIRSIRMQNRFALISFEGINSREAASVWRGALMSVDRGLLPLNEGESYHDQILGLTVETTAGLPLGEVTDIIETGSNDVYVVRSDRREYLIPAIRDVIREIDLDRQKIVVRVVDGLLD
jgi:16S rRNA processing protein RimM